MTASSPDKNLRGRRADFKSLFTRQNADCGTIASQLDGLLAPCSVSIDMCLSVAEPATLAKILCDEKKSFDTWRQLVICRGREFGDDIWTTVCSEVNGSKCYELMEEHSELGNSTFQECCSNNQTTCSNSCQSKLQSLVAELHCCVNSAPFKLLFGSCSLAVNTTSESPESMRLEMAFSSCGVDFPNYCEHPFTNNGQPERVRGSMASVILATVLLFLVYN